MAQIKAVPDATPDPKVGQKPRVSGVVFPGFNLQLSIEVARVIHQAGGALNREQLAARLKYSGTKNGTFLTRVSAAKIFGLLDQPPQSDTVRVTPRGVAIVAPVSDVEALRAKVDAFLSVDLFKTVYDEYKGRELPPDVGLANLFENSHKIIPTRTGPTVKVMLESAETAGLFKTTGIASRKMVMPVFTGSVSAKPEPPQPTTQYERHGGGGGGGGGNGNGGGTPPNIPPAILGLLTDLPPAGTNLSAKKRDSLVAAFTAAVSWIYPDPE